MGYPTMAELSEKNKARTTPKVERVLICKDCEEPYRTTKTIRYCTDCYTERRKITLQQRRERKQEEKRKEEERVKIVAENYKKKEEEFRRNNPNAERGDIEFNKWYKKVKTKEEPKSRADKNFYNNLKKANEAIWIQENVKVYGQGRTENMNTTRLTIVDLKFKEDK